MDTCRSLLSKWRLSEPCGGLWQAPAEFHSSQAKVQRRVWLTPMERLLAARFDTESCSDRNKE